MDREDSRNGQGVGALAAVVADSPGESSPAPSRDVQREVAAIYRAHQRFVWRSLARLGTADVLLPDAVHDVFMVVARRLREFEHRASIKTWLFAICMRVARATRRDFAREQRRRERLESVQVAPAQPHAQADAARALRDMLQQLDENKRAVFIMVELEEMTAPEIAEALSIKTATVYSRLRLARAELERIVHRREVRARREEGQ